MAKVVEDKRRLFKVWKKSKCEIDKAAYTLAKNVARAEVAKAQEAGRKEFGGMLDKADGEGQVFKVAKQIVRRYTDVVGVTCIKDKKGRLTTEMAQIKLVWKEYFEELLNEEFDWQKENLEKVSGVSGECAEITFEEVKVAIK